MGGRRSWPPRKRRLHPSDPPPDFGAAMVLMIALVVLSTLSLIVGGPL